MKYLKLKVCLALFGALLLSACNNDDSNSNSNSNSNSGALQQFSSNTGDSKEIMAPAALKQNLSSLFGPADSEPVSVNNNDTPSSIIQRAATQ